MSEIFRLRRLFIDLVEDIYRELNYPLPEVIHEIEETLTMELESSDVNFEITHSPQRYPERVMVQCQFGSLPQEQMTAVLTALLQANQIFFRSQEAALGINAETNTITYHFPQSLETVRASALIKRIEQAAQRAREWSVAFYSDNMPSPIDLVSDETESTRFRQQFLTLMQDLCNELGTDGFVSNNPDVENEQTVTIPVKLDQKSLSLSHTACIASQCLLECDIGSIPAEHTEDALRRLLELNHNLAAVDTAGFGIDALTGNVMYLRAEKLEDLDGAGLLGEVTDIMELRIEQWSELRVFDADEEGVMEEDEDEEEDADEPPKTSSSIFPLYLGYA